MIVSLIRGATLAMLVLCFSSGSLAATIEEYKSKIDSARKLAIELETELRNDGSNESVTRDFAVRIRRDFPAAERVEWNGGTVETTSGWLLDKARELEGETDPVKRLVSIVEIREYLSAISFKLEELKLAAAAERTKDGDKQKLAEILRREEYQKPQKEQESVVQAWLRRFLEWLESIFSRSGVPAPSFSGLSSLTVLLQILVYGGLLVVLGILVYKIAPLLIPKLKRGRRSKKKKERVILGEQLGEDATATDLFAEAERLAREGNLREAIRKGYVALLCDLSDRKVIGLARNKTNRDYLRDVRSRRDLHPRMKSVTDTFERHWYGFQESADQDWVRFREEYHEAIRSV